MEILLVEILLVLLGICAIIIFICIGIDIAKKEKEKEEYKKIFTPERIKEIHANIEAFIQREKLMRSEVIRFNMFNHYEEKKAEGLAELDKWCKQYNMTIHQMEVFLGLSPRRLY